MTKSSPAGLLSPPAERNKQPLLDVLRRFLPQRGVILEIASGTGQHVVYFAGALPMLTWQPSDPDANSRESIRRWIAHEELSNISAPIDLDVCKLPWPVTAADAVLCANMIHISPWEATLSLMRGAGEVLEAGGLLFLYGPYRRGGLHTSPGNEAFDADLRARNPAWGVRDLEEVAGMAVQAGFSLEEVISMPANNLSVVFRRRNTLVHQAAT